VSSERKKQAVKRGAVSSPVFLTVAWREIRPPVTASEGAETPSTTRSGFPVSAAAVAHIPAVMMMSRVIAIAEVVCMLA